MGSNSTKLPQNGITEGLVLSVNNLLFLGSNITRVSTQISVILTAINLIILS